MEAGCMDSLGPAFCHVFAASIGSLGDSRRVPMSQAWLEVCHGREGFTLSVYVLHTQVVNGTRDMETLTWQNCSCNGKHPRSQSTGKMRKDWNTYDHHHFIRHGLVLLKFHFLVDSAIHKLLELINKSSKTGGYKINKHKSVAFPYTNSK